jgi:hypothetical protein
VVSVPELPGIASVPELPELRELPLAHAGKKGSRVAAAFFQS